MNDPDGEDVAVNDEDPVEENEDERVGRERRSRASGNRWVIAVLAVVALAAVAIGALGWLKVGELEDDTADRQDAAQVAGKFTEAILGYDHTDLDASRDVVLALSTPDFAETYQDAFFTQFRPVILELEATATSASRDVFINEISGDKARAVVLFDAVIDSAVGTRRLVGSYIQVDLQRIDGEWRAGDLVFLAATDQGLEPAGDLTDTPVAPEDPEASTTTSDPATTAPSTATTEPPPG